MKNIILITFLLFTLNSYSQNATRLLARDSREVNAPPSDYIRSVSFEFKRRVVMGASGSGNYGGLITIAPWGDVSGNKNHQLFFNDGGIFYRTGVHEQATWESWRRLLVENTAGHVGIGTVSPENSEGWGKVLEVKGVQNSKIVTSSDVVRTGLWSHDRGFYGAPAGGIVGTHTNHPISFITNKGVKMILTNTGHVGIGTTTPTERLSVNGNIRAKEIRVEAANWPDYVFKEDYRLPMLEEVKQHIRDKGHLPNIPTAKEVEENGVSLGEMNKKLLEKIEELTLYIIRQEEVNKQQQKEIHRLNKRIDAITE